MQAVTTSSVVRAVLSGDLTLSADEVIKRVRTKGVRASDKSIREAVYTVRSELKRGKGPKPVPAAARTTTPGAAAEVVAVAEVVPAVAITVTPAAPLASAGLDLAGVLANVALVNVVVGACGGAEAARKAAEAVRACGGVDAFLQHLELVAGIRGGA